MAVNWPTSPGVGEFYPAVPSPGAHQWMWNGEGWARVSNAGQAVSVFIVAGPFVSDTVELGDPVLNDAQFTLLNYV